MAAILLLVLVSFLDALDASEHPGFTTTLTKHSLDLFSKYGYDMLSSYMSAGKGYDFTIDTGKVGVELNNAVVRWFDPGYKVNVQYDVPTGIDFSIEGVALDLKSQYLATVWLFWNYGVVAVSVRDLKIQATFDTVATGGKLQPQMSSCDISVGSLDLKFHGGLINKMMNLAREKISKEVKELLDEKFCDYLRDKLLPGIQNEFLQVNDSIPLFDDFYINHTILAQPMVMEQYFHMAHDGQVFTVISNSHGKKQDKSSPFKKVSLPFEANFDRMISVQISPWLVTTLIYYIAKYHKIDMDFRENNIPEDYASYFRTSCEDICAGTFFPVLGEKHPNSSLAIAFKFQSSPTVTLTEDKIIVQSVMDLSGSVVNETDVTDVFTGKVEANIFAQNFRFENTSLTTDIKVDKIKILEFSSTYKDIDQESFELILDIAAEDFIQPRLMSLLGNGIVIPKAGPFTLKTGNILVKPDFMTLSADFEY